MIVPIEKLQDSSDGVCKWGQEESVRYIFISRDEDFLYMKTFVICRIWAASGKVQLKSISDVSKALVSLIDKKMLVPSDDSLRHDEDAPRYRQDIEKCQMRSYLLRTYA